MEGENMRYCIFIFILVAVIFITGCVSENTRTVDIPNATMQTPTYANISPTPTTITPLVQTVSTISDISTLGISKPYQIHCGEYKCPPNWFCCNNICYDPTEASNGFCCGDKVCPVEWGCSQTKTGMTCWNIFEPRFNDNIYNEMCEEKFPGSYFDSWYSMCVYGGSEDSNCNKYPKSCNFRNWCVVPGEYPEWGPYTIDNEYQAHSIVIDNTYCVKNYKGTHYNPSTRTCMCYYNESSCPYEHTGAGCAFQP